MNTEQTSPLTRPVRHSTNFEDERGDRIFSEKKYRGFQDSFRDQLARPIPMISAWQMSEVRETDLEKKEGGG